jgi:signal transduction histidine kinase
VADTDEEQPVTTTTQTESVPPAPEIAAPSRVTLAVTEEQLAAARSMGQRILREPFTRRAWSELAYYLLSGGVAFLGLAFVGFTMVAGVILAITFFGLAILALSIRSARGFGGWTRGLARSLLGQEIDDPEPFAHRHGFLSWLQAALRDRVGWRAVGYLFLKVPWAILGALVAFSLWWDAFACLLRPLWGADGGGPPVWGIAHGIVPQSFNWHLSFAQGIAVFILGFLLLLAAPWVMRAFVSVDRVMVRTLLGPDPVTARVRTLEQTRTQTVDASAATLRRIERDLHDGTQAQLVALAMRLGLAKEKLAEDDVDLDRIRALIDEAHRGAKEAIAELRDIARGIHPPALDIGLEGALATLAARSAVPTEVTVSLQNRPTQAIEAIAYYCVAELLANVAQHAQASRASVSCVQQGTWIRLVVRDDGRGGAQPNSVGSSSSGLAGLADRVHAVDGRLSVVSPPGGPTVVTVDLPLAA